MAVIELRSFSTQIAIVGGGIAGLWLLNRLSAAGYHAVLLETGQLGGGQTLAAQGIIHGGLKYALNGVLGPASSAIADMPERWRGCLAGAGEIDLSGVQLLSPNYYMWSDGSARSRLKTFLGSKALRGRVDAIPAADYPTFFQSQNGAGQLRGTLYRLSDFVVDTPSLIKSLAAPWQDRIYHCDQIRILDNGLCLQYKTSKLLLNTELTLLCAGAGNAELLEQWQAADTVAKPRMQRRPLHMVVAQVPHPAPPYLHCIGNRLGMTPRLTLTAHPLKDPTDLGWIWYLGGELAESGVNRSTEDQLAFARQELHSLLPWVDLTEARWMSFMIDRAEPAVSDHQRPDHASIQVCGRVIVCWPTKLTLTPDLGDRVLQHVSATIAPASPTSVMPSLASLLPPVQYGLPPWEHLR